MIAFNHPITFFSLGQRPVEEEEGKEGNTQSECECCGQRHRQARAQNQGGGVT